MAKTEFKKKKKTLFTNKLDSDVRTKLLKFCVWSILHDTGTWEDFKCGAREGWRR
jgi:hypothetical protein